MDIADFNNEVGDIDLYLLDAILKGWLPANSSVLDAGCGAGRNTLFFLNHEYVVKAIDQSRNEVNSLNFIARSMGKGDVAIQGELTELPFLNAEFDVVICTRVLHFAANKLEFQQMIGELKRVLKPDGVLYITSDSSIGMTNHLLSSANDKQQFKDGSVRYLIGEELLMFIEDSYDKLIENRTVIYEQHHAETTTILRKQWD